MPRRGAGIAAVALFVASCTCSGPRACAPTGATHTCSTTETDSFLSGRRESYEHAIARAVTWLDALPVDPVDLRLRGRKGKKHFVEALDVYGRLYQVASASEKPSVMDKIRRLVAITYEDAYHDMLTNDDLAFKQDATSYLRAALLMERLGLDTTRYREEIRRIETRLNGHMRKRGVHQRMVFAWYYAHFGLREPFPLAQAFTRGVISRRLDPQNMKQSEMYELTHEIFGPYEYGDKLDADPFTVDEKVYLHAALPVLIDRRIQRNDPDLVAELVSCIRYLRFTSLDAYRRGLQFLLDSQRSDGAWGNYDRYRGKVGVLVDQAYVLHTTTVAVDALTIAFHLPWNQRIEAWCPPERQPSPGRDVSAGVPPLTEADDGAGEDPDDP